MPLRPGHEYVDRPSPQAHEIRTRVPRYERSFEALLSCKQCRSSKHYPAISEDSRGVHSSPQVGGRRPWARNGSQLRASSPTHRGCPRWSSRCPPYPYTRSTTHGVRLMVRKCAHVSTAFAIPRSRASTLCTVSCRSPQREEAPYNDTIICRVTLKSCSSGARHGAANLRAQEVGRPAIISVPSQTQHVTKHGRENQRNRARKAAVRRPPERTHELAASYAERRALANTCHAPAPSPATISANSPR